jgi:hypothetical protein
MKNNIFKKFLELFAVNNSSPLPIDNVMPKPVEDNPVEEQLQFKEDTRKINEVLNSKWPGYGEKENFDRWLTQYLNKSESPIEKKYKLLFTSLFISQQGWYLGNVLNKNSTIIDKTISEISIIDSEFTLDAVFGNGTQNLNIGNFLIKDQNNKEIVGKVYSDFSDLGLVGNSIIRNRSKLNILLEYQNYQLNESDIKVINDDNISYKKELNKYKLDRIRIKPDSLIDEQPQPPQNRNNWQKVDSEIFEKIINNSEDSKSLEVLRDLLSREIIKNTPSDSSMFGLPSYLRVPKYSNPKTETIKNELLENINKRLVYFNLKSEIESMPVENKTERKKLKL